MKRAFITGVTGQDGAYLAKTLLEKGYEVHGGVRSNAQYKFERLDRLNIADRVILHDFDLSDMNNVLRVINSTPVDEFYNLAAQSFVGTSWSTPLQTLDVNGMGVARILDTLRTLRPETRVYQAATSEMFGKVRQVPQDENTDFYPRSPYGVSKLFSYWLTVNYRESFGLFAVNGILFNHESPLRGTQFVTRKISSTLARIAHGSTEVLYLGNLETKRDWGFAGEYVEGMWRMLQQDVADDYVLATGRSITVRNFVKLVAGSLDLALEWSGEGLQEIAHLRSNGQPVIAISPDFFRPAEVDLLLGDPSKAKRLLGWCPKVEAEGLAEMMAKADYDLVAR